MSTDNRPLSPHLDIYRWRITMLSSILHRASGGIISFGLFLLVMKLVGLATSGYDHYEPLGMLENAFWFLWTIAIYYHLCNGIRHLVWDSGRGFEIETAEKSAKLVLLATAVLTLLTWIFV